MRRSGHAVAFSRPFTTFDRRFTTFGCSLFPAPFGPVDLDPYVGTLGLSSVDLGHFVLDSAELDIVQIFGQLVGPYVLVRQFEFEF